MKRNKVQWVDTFDLACRVKILIQYYYKILDENSAGGLCHIALDDGNLEDENLLFCLRECGKRKDTLGMLIMDILFANYTVEEREEMYDDHWWGMKK